MKGRPYSVIAILCHLKITADPNKILKMETSNYYPLNVKNCKGTSYPLTPMKDLFWRLFRTSLIYLI